MAEVSKCLVLALCGVSILECMWYMVDTTSFALHPRMADSQSLNVCGYVECVFNIIVSKIPFNIQGVSKEPYAVKELVSESFEYFDAGV